MPTRPAPQRATCPTCHTTARTSQTGRWYNHNNPDGTRCPNSRQHVDGWKVDDEFALCGGPHPPELQVQDVAPGGLPMPTGLPEERLNTRAQVVGGNILVGDLAIARASYPNGGVSFSAWLEELARRWNAYLD
jgi:hypothetical protein